MVIENWLQENTTGSLREGTSALTRRYKKGGSSASADLAAYLVTRAPATFASTRHALREVARRCPDLTPKSVLDVGAGAGSATWAAMSMWPELDDMTFLDNNSRFLELAKTLFATTAIRLTTQFGGIAEVTLPTADLVLASYVFAELPLESAASIALKIWSATNQTLVIVEPGTPNGFERLRTIRTALVASGAYVVAPCTHHNTCPISVGDWCHFTVRLPRSREHMHAKSAVVPFEDEPFSYLALSRAPIAINGARVLAPPRHRKFEVELKLCAGNGLHQLKVPRRDKPNYKRSSKLTWGDLLEDES